MLARWDLWLPSACTAAAAGRQLPTQQPDGGLLLAGSPAFRPSHWLADNSGSRTFGGLPVRRGRHAAAQDFSGPQRLASCRKLCRHPGSQPAAPGPGRPADREGQGVWQRGKRLPGIEDGGQTTPRGPPRNVWALQLDVTQGVSSLMTRRTTPSLPFRTGSVSGAWCPSSGRCQGAGRTLKRPGQTATASKHVSFCRLQPAVPGCGAPLCSSRSSFLPSSSAFWTVEIWISGQIQVTTPGQVCAGSTSFRASACRARTCRASRL